MRTAVSVSVILLLGASMQIAVVSDSAAESAPLDQAQIQQLLDTHNEARRADGVKQPLQWAADLAAVAQEWAEIRSEPCDMVHRHDSGLGENIHWASPVMHSGGRTEVQELAPAAVVRAWVDEKADYHYEDNSCNRGKMCGHYTQVVWAQTREVGCGMKVCPNNAQIWVCNYRPAGNVGDRKPF